jgi:hypothetical protein
VNFKIKMNVGSLKSPHVVRFPNLVINPNLTNLQLLTITSFYFYLTFIINMCVFFVFWISIAIAKMHSIIDGGAC